MGFIYFQEFSFVQFCIKSCTCIKLKVKKENKIRLEREYMQYLTCTS